MNMEHYNMEELWKKIEGHETYSVSTHGRVRNDKTGRILKPTTGTNNFIVVNLRTNGRTYCKMVHTLVAKSFLENPDPIVLTDVHHKDTNKSNNHLNNLEYVTHKQNIYFSASIKSAYIKYVTKELNNLLNDKTTDENISTVAHDLLDLFDAYFNRLETNQIHYR